MEVLPVLLNQWVFELEVVAQVEQVRSLPFYDFLD
jgi:hypothetical protein